ncbi:esterase/lipase family protein [Pseudomonas sp. TWP3-1]|uniref:esterase/lipase family protein n=1 Tax=Pseudomonas sp. TWP3-1 TaxID=2804631 RepID=UPI003CF07768
MSDSYDGVTTHVIFFHGLDGDKEKTWLSSSEPTELWPRWLGADYANVGIWSVGYESSATKWWGGSMHLPDRAENVLPLILAERRLQDGNLILIGHSLGGLVIKQLLRIAQRDASNNLKAESFLHRVRRVVFLGTPHFGASLAQLAKLLSPIIRRSSSTRALERNDPNLRDLNNWYRKFCIDSDLENLVLVETKSVRILGVRLPEFLGQVVRPDSSDPGVNATAIPVDADHIQIAKPATRSSEIYIHIGEFVSREFTRQHKDFLIEKNLRVQTAALEDLSNKSEVHTKAIEEVGKIISSVERIVSTSSIVSGTSKIVDNEACERLEIIAKSRLFLEYESGLESKKLAESLRLGDLSGVSVPIKTRVFSWCARFISVSDIEYARDLIDEVSSTDAIDETKITKAFIAGQTGDLLSALALLDDLKTPTSRSAALILMRNIRGASEALKWTEDSEVCLGDLDSDGKFFLVQSLVECDCWDEALKLVERLSEEDHLSTPALAYLSAIVYLAQAVPAELRALVYQTPPFEARTFPLAGDQQALQFRRKSLSYFEGVARSAASLNLNSMAEIASDSALWLALRDVQRYELARRELEQSMSDRGASLRRLPLAMQFGLNIDVPAVEREIERRTALSGGKSSDAAVARFALAFKQNSPRAVASYIDRHRSQLIGHLNYKTVAFLEIEMLIRSGQKTAAEERLREVIEAGVSDLERKRIERLVFEASDSDLISQRVALYESSKSITDLHNVVSLLEEQQDWGGLVNYASEIFVLTRDIKDAQRYARALYNAGKVDEALGFCTEYSIFLEQSEELQRIRCWSLYEKGRFVEARDALHQLKKRFNEDEQRSLTISIAVASGDWDSLQVNVEEEWRTRETRSAMDLIRAAKLAQLIASPRLKELVFEAARKGEGDPQILIACYGISTECGWEEGDLAFGWMQTASELSDKDGPVLKMSLQEVMDRQPDWEEQTGQAYKKMVEGDIPIFVAARLHNKNLLNFYLALALNNLDQVDARKRSVIFSFSGSRPTVTVTPDRIAMDVTALLTLELIGVLDSVLSSFSVVMIAHGTLKWLFDERRSLSFHQPSKVREAHELKQLIAAGTIKHFETTMKASTAISSEVGEGLASMLAVASDGLSSTVPQRLVVHPGPVHRIGSLVMEEADLSDFSACLCNCQAVIEKLIERGVLTAAEAQVAKDFLSPREHTWPQSPVIADSAHLYLDDLAVSYFQHLKLLPKLSRSGLTVYVSPREVSESDELISYEKQALVSISVLENLRLRIRDGIVSGRIVVGSLSRDSETEDEKSMRDHPCLDVLKLINVVDAIVSDDRYINKFLAFEQSGVSHHVLTTVDILYNLSSRGVLTDIEVSELKTQLRRMGMALVPVDAFELKHHLLQSKIVDGQVIENAGLKALRESVLRIAMSDILQLPKEFPWLHGIFQESYNAMRELWYEGAELSISIARSNWLFNLLDIRKWSHRFSVAGLDVKSQFEAQLMALMVVPNHQSSFVRKNYSDWLEGRILRQLKEEDPVLFSSLIEQASVVIEHGLKQQYDNEVSDAQ